MRKLVLVGLRRARSSRSAEAAMPGPTPIAAPPQVRLPGFSRPVVGFALVPVMTVLPSAQFGAAG